MSDNPNISREDFEPDTDTIYVQPDGSACISPDGVGLIWYDTERHAFEDVGRDPDYKVIHLDGEIVY